MVVRRDMTLNKVMIYKPYVVYQRIKQTKNQFADNFFISCIEEVRQLKRTKKSKMQVSVG